MKNKNVKNLLDSIDLYGARANEYTIKGRTNVYSITGVICSILHITAIVIFSAIKFNFLITKHNPNIAVFDEVEQH